MNLAGQFAEVESDPGLEECLMLTPKVENVRLETPQAPRVPYWIAVLRSHETALYAVNLQPTFFVQAIKPFRKLRL
jgi:hypothetical protein